MKQNNNLWKFLFGVFIVGWSFFEMYPPTSRDLVKEFATRSDSHDAAFSNILARADALFAALAASVRGNPIGHAGVFNALDFRLRAKEIATVGAARGPLYEAALAAPFSGRIVIDLDRPQDLPLGHPAHAQAALAGEGAAAFVCSGGACSLPVRDVEELRALIAAG